MMRRPLTSIELQPDDVEDMKSTFKEYMDKMALKKKKAAAAAEAGANQPGPSGVKNLRCSSGLDIPAPTGEDMATDS